VTTGAHDDLEKSTKMARRMVTEFGMSEKLGPMTFGKRHEQVFLGREFGHERDYGEKVATLIDEEVNRIVSEQYERVKELLAKHRPHMDEIVAVLLEKETLDRKEVDAILDAVNKKLGLAPETNDQNDGSDKTPPPTAVTLDGGKVLVTPTAPKPEKEPPQDPQPGLTPKFA
jgi:cell division protease FtsH